MILNSAESSPLDGSNVVYIKSHGKPVHSATNSASLGSILATLQLLRKDYSFTFPLMSLARFSFMELSELGGGGNKNAQTSKW